jgi:hypothetical protein
MDFDLYENIASYLYMSRLCFKHMTFMCKMYKHMKEQFYVISITKSWDVKFVLLQAMATHSRS